MCLNIIAVVLCTAYEELKDDEGPVIMCGQCHAKPEVLCLPLLQISEVQCQEKKLAASSMLHEAKIAYYAFYVIRCCVPYAARLKLRGRVAR